MSATLLEHSPRDVYALVKQGTAYGHLIEEFRGKYPVEYLMSVAMRAHYLKLIERNQSLFVAAEALGWEPVE